MSQPAITLTPEDLAAAYEHGRERDAARGWSRNYGIERAQTHIRGLKAELAVAQYYDLDADLSFRPDGDGGVDFRVELRGEPTALDVKATQYISDPWLKVRADAHHAADAYLLVAVDGACARLVGWADAETVLATEPSDATGHHRNHVLRGDDLEPVPEPDAVSELASADGLSPAEREFLANNPVSREKLLATRGGDQRAAALDNSTEA